jgi:hypothetical protein
MSDLIYTALCPVFRGALACAAQKNGRIEAQCDNLRKPS